MKMFCTALCALAFILPPWAASADDAAPAIVLPKGATAVRVNALLKTRNIENVEGWLLCNGATFSVVDYPELAADEKPNNQPKDQLPSLPAHYRDGKLYSGYAINPSFKFGLPTGAVREFEIAPSL